MKLILSGRSAQRALLVLNGRPLIIQCPYWFHCCNSICAAFHHSCGPRGSSVSEWTTFNFLQLFRHTRSGLIFFSKFFSKVFASKFKISFYITRLYSFIPDQSRRNKYAQNFNSEVDKHSIDFSVSCLFY